MSLLRLGGVGDDLYLVVGLPFAISGPSRILQGAIQTIDGAEKYLRMN
jgi:hypothetical protein